MSRFAIATARADRVAAEGDPVDERAGPGQERLGQPVRHDHRAQRDVSAGEPLGAGDDVGLVAVPRRAEVLAEPAERADHLVGDQQHVVPVADLPDPLEVAGRRREAAAGVLHRLQVDGGHGVRPLGLDRLVDPVGRPPAELLRRVAGVRRAPVEVRVRHPERRRDQRLEVLLERRDAGDRQRAHGGAVVGHLPGDHLVLQRLADQRKYDRASFQALSTASEPPVVKKTRLRSPGARSASRSASSIAVGCA